MLAGDGAVEDADVALGAAAQADDLADQRVLLALVHALLDVEASLGALQAEEADVPFGHLRALADEAEALRRGLGARHYPDRDTDDEEEQDAYGPGSEPHPVEVVGRPDHQRALQPGAALVLHRDLDLVLLAVVVELGLPVDDVRLVDVVLDDGQALVDVLDGGRRLVGPAGAPRDLLETCQGVLLQLGVAHGVDGNAPLGRLGDHLLDVRRRSVVAAVRDHDDRLGCGEGAGLHSPTRSTGVERDGLRQSVVQEEALPRARHLAELPRHLSLVGGERS